MKTKEPYLSCLLQQLGDGVDDVRLLGQQTFLSTPIVGLAQAALVGRHHFLHRTLGCRQTNILSLTQPSTLF